MATEPARADLSRGVERGVQPQNLPSKLKTYGFAIAIILGICGFAVCGTGVAGYNKVGALRDLSQANAIIMMAVGGSIGILLLIMGVVGFLKNRGEVSPPQRHVTFREGDSIIRE